jgi:hypothetical protein
MITDVQIRMQLAVHVKIFYLETWSEFYFYKLKIKAFVVS